MFEYSYIVHENLSLLFAGFSYVTARSRNESYLSHIA